MRKVNFDTIKNVPVPDELLQKALDIPSAAPARFGALWLRRTRILATAASVVLIAVLGVVLYLLMGQGRVAQTMPSPTGSTEYRNIAPTQSETVFGTSDQPVTVEETSATQPAQPPTDPITGETLSALPTQHGTQPAADTPTEIATVYAGQNPSASPDRTHPTTLPIDAPSSSASHAPDRPQPTSIRPTAAPYTPTTAPYSPTTSPIIVPTAAPTVSSTERHTEPHRPATEAPTAVPTAAPTQAPTKAPTQPPTAPPTQAPRPLCTAQFSSEKLTGTLYCCIYDSRGKRVGGGGGFDELRKVQQITTSGGTVTAVYDPEAAGLSLTSGDYQYEFYCMPIENPGYAVADGEETVYQGTLTIS